VASSWNPFKAQSPLVLARLGEALLGLLAQLSSLSAPGLSPPTGRPRSNRE
jgi:hypothetical protein